MKTWSSGEIVGVQQIDDGLDRERHQSVKTHPQQWSLRQIFKGNQMQWNPVCKVPTNILRRNVAEKVISTFKDHFQAILVGVDNIFLMHLWDSLLPQAENTWNMLGSMSIAPTISAFTYINGQQYFNKMPLATMRCAVLLYNKPDIW